MQLGQRFFLFLALMVSSSIAMAAIEKRGVSGPLLVRDEGTALTHVYSGKTSVGCTGDGTKPCNSCGSATIASKAPNFSCNETEVYDNLKFSITLRSSLAAAYLGPTACPSLIVAIPPSATQALASDTPTTYVVNGSTGVANQDVTATFTWTRICANSEGNVSDCKRSFKSRWQFGFVKNCGQTSINSTEYNDTLYSVEFHHRYVAQSPPMSFNGTTPCNNNTASPYENVCHFQVFPGDEKVYLTPLLANNSSNYVVPAIETDGAYGTVGDRSEQKYANLRVYFIEGANNFSNILLDRNRNLPLEGTNLTDSRIDGLTNGVTYSFIAANVDQGGNVTHFAIPGGFASSSTVTNDPTLPVTFRADDDGNGQNATPQPVYGLLDGKDCFVATAAYGSTMAPQVEMLRQFRGEYLLKNAVGKSFVQFYYKHSPAFAAWIAESEVRRAVARVVLQPIVFLADLTMASGMGAWTGFIAFVFGVMGLGVAVAGSFAWVMVWGRRWLRVR